MTDRDIEAVMPVIATRLARHSRITPRLLEKHIIDTRRRGYAVMVELVVERMGGIAMPILGGDGRPLAAISIAALTDRITSREDALAAALEREVTACESFWNRAANKAGGSPRGREERPRRRATPMKTAYVAGAGNTSFGRHEGRGPLDLMAEAAGRALDDAASRFPDRRRPVRHATTLPHLMLSTLFGERFSVRRPTRTASSSAARPAARC